MGILAFLKKEYSTFSHALVFFTRLPSLPFFQYNKDHEKNVLRYYSLTGLGIGSLSAFFYLVSLSFFPHDISVLVCLILTLFLTGALHEDGLADSFDSLWGGKTVEEREKILKDSRLGTYGVLALIASFVLKFEILNSISDPMLFVFVVICGHTLSRFYSAFFLILQKYKKTSETKSNDIALSYGWKNFLINFLISYGVAFCLLPGQILLGSFLILPVILLIHFIVKKKMGFLKGDFLGAAQQISEISFYLIFLVLFKKMFLG